MEQGRLLQAFERIQHQDIRWVKPPTYPISFPLITDRLQAKCPPNRSRIAFEKCFCNSIKMWPMELQIKQQRIKLLPEGAAYWVNTKSLLIADAHLGKIAHFRKNGCRPPKSVFFL